MFKQTLERSGEQCISVSFSELLQLAPYAKKLNLSAMRIKSMQTGPNLSRMLGKGMEFAESRRYQSGDDIRCIDWKITARTGHPHTKLFTEEKERQILMWIDMRAPMFFATKGVFKSVQASLLAGYIGWNATLTGNRLGGFIFDDINHHEFRPMLGKKSILPFLQKLTEYGIHSKQESPQEPFGNMDKAILSIQRVASPGSLIFFASDFRYLSTHACELLIQISRHSDLCLCFLYDPFEANLFSSGSYSVANKTAEIKLYSNQHKAIQKYHQQFMERKNRVMSLSHHQRIYFIEICTEEDCFEKLKKTFR